MGISVNCWDWMRIERNVGVNRIVLGDKVLIEAVV